MPESKPVHFALETIRVLDFEEVTRRLPTADRGEGTLTYVPRFGLGFDEEAQRIGVSVLMDVFLSDDEADAPSGDVSEEELPDEEQRVARIEVICRYHLPSLDSVRDEGGSVCVPRMLVAHLVGLSLSAVRGALVGRTHHPIFQRAPLPIERPVEFVDALIDASGADWVESAPAKAPSA